MKASSVARVWSGVFVFDEPTIELHPLDVKTLLNVFMRLIKSGATAVLAAVKLSRQARRRKSANARAVKPDGI